MGLVSERDVVRGRGIGQRYHVILALRELAHAGCRFFPDPMTGSLLFLPLFSFTIYLSLLNGRACARSSTQEMFFMLR